MKKTPAFSLDTRGYQQAAEATLGKGWEEQRNEALARHGPASARGGRRSLCTAPRAPQHLGRRRKMCSSG